MASATQSVLLDFMLRLSVTISPTCILWCLHLTLTTIVYVDVSMWCLHPTLTTSVYAVCYDLGVVHIVCYDLAVDVVANEPWWSF